ncbi:MAG: hypothetical protein E7294_06625 [Lachnospiraceae bacterium]|nr:hypothetical protein [Lachnospiraceae bacterium]
MEKEKAFQKALTDFTFDVACGGAISHMVDKGYTVRQITQRLDYPLSYEKAQKAVTGYLLKKRILLFDEPDFSKDHVREEYVKEYGPGGRSSFRKVVIGKTEAVLDKPWKESGFVPSSGQMLMDYLGRKTQENTEEYAYISCDFGLYRREEYQSFLNSRQIEYIDGILWQKKRAYHRLDYRMKEIAGKLILWDNYQAVCYFAKTGECVRISAGSAGNEI